MRYFEVEGDTPEEMYELFLREQKISAEFVTMEVIEQGSKGILGLGRKSAKVKMIFNDQEFYKRKIKLFLSDLLTKTGFNDYHIEVKEKLPNIYMDILTDEDEQELVGRGAAVLDSFQYIIDRVFRPTDELRFLVDVNNYRSRVIPPIVAKATKLAYSVKKSGKPAKLQPLAALVRREVHLAIKPIAGVTTLSNGNGVLKSISILPERKPAYHSRHRQ
ncbi:MAG: Jag N-terminal domain-containing protein [Deferribacteraceae bacterium]|jgi:spoIIIJ-associated protein|nr:Jag N-terminal domain-containing protein [Deferribacteraceae bacterium]